MKRLSILLTLALAAMLLMGCAGLDVVLAQSRTSLDGLLAAHPNLLSQDASGLYERVSVDGETALLVSRDFATSGAEDIRVETPLQPFLDAGLDVSRLANGYRADGDVLYLSADFGDGADGITGVSGAIAAAADFAPLTLSYHAELDHFGISLGSGKFEWAKDIAANDKDVVFVLDAATLGKLGVDTANVSGWLLVTMQDDKGKDFDLLLKPYSLGAENG